METRPAILDTHASDEGDLGPAMAALPTERMRAFVYAMLDTGGKSYFECAKIAGYNGSDNTLRVRGHQLAHDERVQAAIQEQARKRLQAGAILAVSQVLHLAEKGLKEDTRLRAAQMIMDRAGLHVVQEIKVTRPENEKAMIREIAELARALQVDPRKMLGSQGIDIQDAEFEEIMGPVKEDPATVDWDNL